MADQLTIGVIGHVDHGKTTLVKALTGMETDRLAEEKRRGLSIVLGFAYRETPRGLIDFIDAPGHADFVRNMIAGATGIDAALVVIAANERIMPQTVEHVRIASLLGIKRCVVALTKTDLVSPEDTAAAADEARSFLKDGRFTEVSVAPVCAPSGLGIDELVTALECLFAGREARTDVGRFYLPFDRVFSARGFGVVSTGTLSAGVMTVGDVGEILPAGWKATVRRLEVHGQETKSAKPGQRVAVNLRIDGGGELARGMYFASPGWLAASEFWDAALTLSDDRNAEIKNGASVRILHGAKETIARAHLLDRNRLRPGETANVQFKLAKPDAAWNQERFIVRSITPVATIGGGQFLDTQAKRRKRFDDDANKQLEALTQVDTADALATFVAGAGADGVELSTLAEKFGLSEVKAKEQAISADCVVAGNGLTLDASVASDLRAQTLSALATFHKTNPARAGLARNELSDLAALPPAAFDATLAQLLETSDVVDDGGSLSAAGFDPFESVNQKDRELLSALETRIKNAGVAPPTLGELAKENSRFKSLAQILIESKRVAPIYDGKRVHLFLFHKGAIDDAVGKLREALPPPTEFRAGEAREALGATRKYVVPLLEYLDKQGVTQRSQDFRQLVDR
jgi:selenocysteine-specific elongation factor